MAGCGHARRDLPPSLQVAVVTERQALLYEAVPAIGPEHAIQAAHTVFLAGAAGLAFGFGWTVWTIWTARCR